MTASPESRRECSTVDSWAICRQVDKAPRERLALARQLGWVLTQYLYQPRVPPSSGRYGN